MAEVKVIKATMDGIVKPGRVLDRIRVAAYCRVSTDTEDQMNSYHSQVRYYKEMIAKNPDWQMVEIYADAAITGTKVDKREGFRKMISDSAEGKLDMVITKSISRFARNTVDTLKYVRMLKDKGVAVFFEDENINTMTMDGELLLTVLSSVAQQEVENISANVKKGLKMKMSRGELIGFNGCLGYDYDPETKSISVNEEEKSTVEYIFNRYMEGVGFKVIGDELRRMGRKKKDGTTDWKEASVRYVISNVKYKGDIVLGSTYTTDPISKKRVKNRGQQDKFYVEDHHEPIIDRDLFDAAQLERKRRSECHKGKMLPTTNKHYAFSGAVKCGFCGATLTRKTIHGNTKEYRKFVWGCGNYIKNGKKTCPHCKVIREEILKGAFVDTFRIMSEEKSDLVGFAIDEAFEFMDPSIPEEEIKELRVKLAKETEKRQRVLDLLVNGSIDDQSYTDKVGAIDSRIISIRNRISHCEEKSYEIDRRRKGLRALKDILDRGELLEEFDEVAFEETVQKMVVGGYDEAGNPDPHCIMIVLKDGEKHIKTGRNYVPQRKNAAARRYPADFDDKAYMEVFSFCYYSKHFEFIREGGSMRKIPRSCVNVRVVMPLYTGEPAEEKGTTAA